MNNSPWIDSLTNKFKADILSSNLATDVAVIGGGISGVLTAYYILKHTSFNICILDAGDFGFAATGHNSGYMVAGFDNSMQELVDKFGEQLTRNAHVDITTGWYRFFEIFQEIPSIQNYFEFVISKSGFVDLDSFVNAIEEFQLAKRIGIFQDVQFYAIQENYDRLPDNLKNDVEVLTIEEINENFDVVDKIHVGYSMMNPVAMMNSCQLVQDILKYLQEKYPDRIEFYSHSKVDNIELSSSGCKLKVNNFEISTDNVVLCTNAFQIPKIVHKTPEIRQVVNYLLGFVIEEKLKRPESFFYQMHHPSVEGEFDYVYGTKRNFMNKSLITFGSTKDTILKPESKFTFEETITQESENFAISEVVKYVKFPKSENPNKPDFAWQGMMAYTENNLRIVGPSVQNPNLIYNIGCNGIGIVPAFFSGDKIGRILKGENFEKSVFDPLV